MHKTVIHIGCPKSGSTFLQRYFALHPSIHYNQMDFASYRKTGVIDEQLVRKEVSEPHLMLSEEQLSVWGGNLKVGVKFNAYDIKKHQDQTAAQLAALCPDAKILYVSRGFETLIPSLYSQYLSIGGIMKFPEFLDANKHVFTEFYHYDYLLGVYEKYFGKENVLTLPFEMLKENPADFVRIIEDFYGFEAMSVTSEEVNKSISPDDVPLFLMMSNLVYNSIRFLPYKWQEKIYDRYSRALYNKKERLQSKRGRSVAHPLMKEILPLFKGTTTNLVAQKHVAPYSDQYLFE